MAGEVIYNCNVLIIGEVVTLKKSYHAVVCCALKMAIWSVWQKRKSFSSRRTRRGSTRRLLFLSDLNRSSPNVSQAAVSWSSRAIRGNCKNGEIVSEATPTNDHDVDGDDRESESSQDEDVIEVVTHTSVENNGTGSSLETLQKQTLC